MSAKRARGQGRWTAFRKWFPWRHAVLTFIAAFALLFAMRIPLVQESVLGEPDRAMRELAFKLRNNVFTGPGDPVLLLDIDDATLADPAYGPEAAGRAPSPAAPRPLIADLLDYARRAPSGRGAKVVVLDVDIGSPAPDAERLKAALSAWAADPAAPPLIIARAPAAAAVLKLNGQTPVLPLTDYDAVVAGAQNIFWGSPRMLGDVNGVVRELLPYECVRQPGGVKPLFSSALLAYGVLAGGPERGSPAAQWLAQGDARCAKSGQAPPSHGELINYHLSIPAGGEAVFPSIRHWSGAAACGESGTTPVMRRLSAAVVAEAGPQASTDILCRRLVIIGGTNSVAGDSEETPYGQTPGAVILANATRGLQISHGGLRELPLLVQTSVLAVITLSMTLAFALSRDITAFYADRKRETLLEHLMLVPLNPVVLNWIVGFTAHFIGVALLLLSLSLGYWGFLSGPAFGAALVETAQGFRTTGKDHTHARRGRGGQVPPSSH